MRAFKLIGIVAAIVLCIACFYPWVLIQSKGIILTGINTTGSNYGKPGYLHLVFSAIYIVLLLLPKLWSRRVNFFFSAINLSWALRNYFLLSACYAGECPEKRWALYLLPVCSLIMLLIVLFAPERAIMQEHTTN